MAINGMAMLFKSLGLNPEEIVQRVEMMMQGVNECVQAQKRIEQKLDRLLAMQPDRSQYIMLDAQNRQSGADVVSEA